MSRQSYTQSSGHVYNAVNTFSISPHRFQPRTRSAIRWRRQLVIKIGSIALISTAIVFFLFPSMRDILLPTLGLGFVLRDDALLSTVKHYDLSNVQGTARGWEREERILFCVPLRDAEAHLPMFFAHMRNFTYPHHLIDLAFLVSDSKDQTLPKLKDYLQDLQNDQDFHLPYGEISLIEKDFGQKVKQDVENRHGFAAQASRRKTMAQARNWLLSAALRPYHSWVYWRDADDLMRHNKDVIVPNVWRPLPDWLGGEQPYDLNSWQESETALALADTLHEDAVIVEGYAEYATWRPHLAYLRDPYGDPDVEMEIDGVGGVSILAKAKVFRAGVHFPAFSFEKHAETEGFGKMAKRMRFSVVGLPHYTIWHLYEPSADDLKHMERMEEERKTKEAAEKSERERQAKLKNNFANPKEQWEMDKKQIEDAAMQAKTAKEGKDKVLVGGEAGPHAHAGEGETKAYAEKDVKKVRGKKPQ
ncbi:Anp1-domain-containing protein [Trichophaea hybrida]|nr:Anp1-domain-containing protein [Trichophaea hybrida]